MKRVEYIEHKKELVIPKRELNLWEKRLNSETLNYKRLGWHECSVVKDWRVNFANGYSVLFQVNTNLETDGNLFVDIQLFDSNGNVVDDGTPYYELKGEWRTSTYDHRNNVEECFIVNVKTP